MQARDTVRKADLEDIEKVIELHKATAGDYPMPNNAQLGEIEGFSGVTWHIGEFGIEMASMIKGIEKIPKDPNTNQTYTYALSNDLQSYRIVAKLEETDKEYAVLNKVNCSEGYKFIGEKCEVITCENNLTQLEVDELNNLTGENHNIETWCSQTNLALNNKGLTEIPSGISKLLNLTNLEIYENPMSDLTPLSGLTKLELLDLGSNQNISDLKPLKSLTKLQVLKLQDNQISDISPLSGLVNLHWLRLDVNKISDISSLSGLTNLTILMLQKNQIINISSLSGLTNLQVLRLSYNQIINISSLSGLTSLRKLVLGANPITDISPISGLNNLTFLRLGSIQISDISSLVGLQNLEHLYLSHYLGNLHQEVSSSNPGPFTETLNGITYTIKYNSITGKIEMTSTP